MYFFEKLCTYVYQSKSIHMNCKHIQDPLRERGDWDDRNNNLQRFISLKTGKEIWKNVKTWQSQVPASKVVS